MSENIQGFFSKEQEIINQIHFVPGELIQGIGSVEDLDWAISALSSRFVTLKKIDKPIHEGPEHERSYKKLSLPDSFKRQAYKAGFVGALRNFALRIAPTGIEESDPNAKTKDDWQFSFLAIGEVYTNGRYVGPIARLCGVHLRELKDHISYVQHSRKIDTEGGRRLLNLQRSLSLELFWSEVQRLSHPYRGGIPGLGGKQ